MEPRTKHILYVAGAAAIAAGGVAWLIDTYRTLPKAKEFAPPKGQTSTNPIAFRELHRDLYDDDLARFGV